MSLHGRAPSFLVTVLALASWACSLAFPAFSDYSGRLLSGLNTLLCGWLGPLNLTFAWYANIFFLAAVARLLRGGTTRLTPLLALIISLDTLRFTSYPLNEGGATAAIYGYGFGAFLWFLSLTLLLIAAGLRLKEQNDGRETSGKRLFFMGSMLALALLTATVCFSVRDRIIANRAEQHRLEKILFKRTAVCSAPEPEASRQVSIPDGPLEVRVPRHASKAHYPFSQIKDYLKWGVRTVRFGGRDYTIRNVAGEMVLVSNPAAIPATALLEVEDQEEAIVARLSDQYLNRVIFEQKWAAEPTGRRYYYCPDYHTSPSQNQQPRKLLVEALGLTEEAVLPDDVFYNKMPYETVEGEVSGLATRHQSREERIQAWRQAHPGDMSFPYRVMVNYNCPDNIGWDRLDNEPINNTGNPFVIDGQSYYWGLDGYRAYCDGPYVYIYQVFSHFSGKGKYTLNITRRTLPELQYIWTRLVQFKVPGETTIDNTYEIQGFREARGVAEAVLVHYQSGNALSLTFPVVVEDKGE
ncbi:hypothetical protein [Geothermobacter hydrogeniphilus]|uniref:Uncharacterized protein n=1 Tax=Geothermobacter hydrogeniphilus TaxID=1969733 RepID=A0A1X0Y8R9_9BACT|nr:hypothetical protein [Geothermobacter hydrogeniphilus]ORJ61502.1 hypothetical protein B5V00_05545 [Geothermobacter hydrogeniphilus]